jgi:hypothetical protein
LWCFCRQGLSRPAMGVVPPHAIVLPLVSLLLDAAASVVVVSGRLRPAAGHRVVILSAELFATLPTPGAAAAGPYDKSATRIEATGKDVVAGRILQAPAGAPGALLGVVGHSLRFALTFFARGCRKQRLHRHNRRLWKYIPQLVPRFCWKPNTGHQKMFSGCV